MVDEITHKLSYKIKAHGDDIDTLTFREPTGADIVVNGNPMGLDGRIDVIAMESMMSALAGVPPSTIKQLKAKDWNTIQRRIALQYFFPDLTETTG